MKNSLISVIVTCYNRENTIKECLESIKNQTYKNFECIIVDDGSTDSSKIIIKENTNLRTRELSDGAMVAWIKKSIEEEVQCYLNQ